jgi:serine/threonine-protein kinase
MSPEQALGVKTLDARSDIYSVGVMLYEGLARRRPYEAETLPALVLKIHHGEHVPIAQAVPSLPRSLAETVERALSVDPTRRFGSAEEMLAALVPHSDSQFVTSLQTLRNAAPAFAETLDTSAARAPKSATAAAATQPPGVSRRAAYVVAAIVALAWMGVGAVLWIDGRDDVETSTDVAPRREPIDPQAPPPQAPQPQAPPPQPQPLASPVPAGTAPPPSDFRAPSTLSPAERDRAPGEAETTTTPRRSERPSPRVSTDSAGMREPTSRSPDPVEGRFEIERGW